MQIAISYSNPNDLSAANLLAQQLNLPVVTSDAAKRFTGILIYNHKHQLELRLSQYRTPIIIDFTHGKIAYRCRWGGGRDQLLARAIGLSKYKHLTVLDITAGLGSDSYILAYLGAKVTMLERNPIIAALLNDGLLRATAELTEKKLHLQLEILDAKHYLLTLTPEQRPDIVYLDPMFPDSKNTALAKKEMRILRDLVGEDEDAGELLTLALQTAKRRVVVKRPKLGDPIPGLTPSFNMTGKSNRFDIYLR